MAATTESTIKACNELYLNSIPEDWADQAWEAEFCESSGLPDVLQDHAIEFNYFGEAFTKLLGACRQWARREQDSTREGKFNARNVDRLLTNFRSCCKSVKVSSGSKVWPAKGRQVF